MFSAFGKETIYTEGVLSGFDNKILGCIGLYMKSPCTWTNPNILSPTALRLVTPVITVIVAVTLQLLGHADPTGTQKVLTSSTQC